MPKLSVVIATYNRAYILPRALDSLLKQGFKDWEAWIVDDGSTDGTKKVVEAYIDRGLPINYIKQENQGVAMARSKAIPYCNGEFVTFLDSDDWYKPEHLQSRMNILLKNLKIDLLHGGFMVLGDPYVPNKNNLETKIHLSKCFVGATMFVKKEIIKELGGFKKLPLGADADLFERAKEKGVKIMKTEIPTYVYDRTGVDSITLSFNAQ